MNEAPEAYKKSIAITSDPALKSNAYFNLALIQALIRAKPSTAKGIYLRSITLSSTMGPGVRVDPVHFSTKAEEG